MELTPTQQKKLEHLAKYAEDKDLATLEHFLSISDKLDDHKTCMDEMLSDIKDIKDKEYPEPKDEQANFDAIMAKLDEPIEIELEIV